MISIILTEFEKIKRYELLWIGYAAMLLSGLFSLFQITAGNDPGQPLYQNLVNSVIWNNYSLFLPFVITLIGGSLISREYTDQTLKTILPIPISFRKLLAGKLITLGIISAVAGVFSFLCTTVLWLAFFHEGVVFSDLLKALLQISGMSLFNFVAVLPIILLFSRKPNAFFAGAGLAFVYGFCGIFVAGRNLADYYPVTAGLGIIGFSGDTGSKVISYNPLMGWLVLAAVLVISVVILLLTKYDPDGSQPKQKNMKKNGH